MKLHLRLTNLLFILALLLAAFEAPLKPSGRALVWPTPGMSWLHTEGPWLVNENGSVVILRGCNYMGMEFGWLNHREEDFERMASWGFNVVRLPIAWSYIEPRLSEYDEAYLEKVDRIISWCHKNGLYVVLDMHQWNWAPKFGGNGLPDWAVEAYTGQDEAKAGFWKDALLQQRFAEMWRYVARRYKDEPAVAAYDLFNEGNVDYARIPAEEFEDLLYGFYEDVIEAIHTVDQRHIVVYMPPWGNDMSVVRRIDATNVVFSTHLYTGGTWDGETGYTVDKAELERDLLRGYQRAVEEWNIPLWIGEFGVGSAAYRAQEWVADMLSFTDKYMLGYAWWTYWRDESSFGLLYENGTEKRAILDVLDRVYPQACTIPPRSFSYDKQNAFFSLATSQPLHPVSLSLTLHIPAELLEERAVFCNATDWDLSWNPGNRTLLVTATPVSLPVVVQVSPSPGAYLQRIRALEQECADLRAQAKGLSQTMLVLEALAGILALALIVAAVLRARKKRRGELQSAPT